LLNSKAITKIQATLLMAIIVVAAVAGVVYVFWSGDSQQTQTITIGVAADLDAPMGKDVWQAAPLCWQLKRLMLKAESWEELWK